MGFSVDPLTCETWTILVMAVPHLQVSSEFQDYPLVYDLPEFIDTALL